MPLTAVQDALSMGAQDLVPSPSPSLSLEWKEKGTEQQNSKWVGRSHGQLRNEFSALPVPTRRLFYFPSMRTKRSWNSRTNRRSLETSFSLGGVLWQVQGFQVWFPLHRDMSESQADNEPPNA